jgi:1-acyl-sn-glycerol-3-phosphate acyltransferase
MNRKLSLKKLNRELIFRYIITIIFIIILYTPTFLVPRKILFKYSFFMPFFVKLYLFFSKVRGHDCTEKPCSMKQDEPVFYVSNHKSYVDSTLVARFINRDYTFVMKAEMARNPFFKIIIAKIGLIPMDRSDVLKQRHALDKIKRMSSRGTSIIYFPEGWYTFDKPVGTLKSGIAKLARETGLKVVPIAINGIHNDFIYEKKLVWKDVFLKAGQTMRWSDYNDDKTFLTELKKRIENLYLELDRDYIQQSDA